MSGCLAVEQGAEWARQLFAPTRVLTRMRAIPEEACPRCGYGAGLFVAPRDARTADTPVRCLSCHHEAVIDEWRHSTANSEPQPVPARGFRP